MITLNIQFTDAEHKRMRKAKLKARGNKSCLSWHEFILRKCCKGVRR